VQASVVAAARKFGGMFVRSLESPSIFTYMDADVTKVYCVLLEARSKYIEIHAYTSVFSYQ